MSSEIKMPKISSNMTEGVILKWSKGQGESVNCGDVLFEMKVDASIKEVEAKQSGILKRIIIKEGEIANPDDIVAVMI